MKASRRLLSNIGPATLVAAAFIGPGTVTLCTLAGVNFGLSLLWAMMLSVVATVVLQEMAARLGVISQKGLVEIIKTEISTPFFRKFVVVLMLVAIVIGNASYEAGNISGGVLGLETIFNPVAISFFGFSMHLFSILTGGIAFVLLYLGNYKILERVLVLLVFVMSVSFVITAVITKPPIIEILKGAFVPKVPKGSLLTIIGLIGTTVVPYNLFLHTSLVKEKWKTPKDLKAVRRDTMISIFLGGLVSMTIIIASASITADEILNASDLAKSLEPLYGSFAKYFLAVGLFAAGITSAITAPLAAAYVAKGCFGWHDGMKSKPFRSVWMGILFLGVVFSSMGIKPIEIIKFAQVANAILLPIIAGILLWVVNKKRVLGKYVNSKAQNILGLAIVLLSLFLGVKGILKIIQF